MSNVDRANDKQVSTKSRVLTRRPAKAIAVLAALATLALLGSLSAQPRRRAATPPPPQPTWAPRISEVIRGGVVTAGIGLHSSTRDEATGNLRLQMPAGSTIRAAWLYSSAYNFNGGTIRPIEGHRFVRIGTGEHTQTRNIEGNGDSTRRETIAAFNGRPSYHLFVTNVTETLRALATAAGSMQFDVAIAERGDDAEATNTWIAGHSLVVEYELAIAPPRIIVVADGVTPLPITQATALTQTITLPTAVGSNCQRNQAGYEPAVMSMAMALDLAGCDENATVRVAGAAIATRAGGPDDMTPAATGACVQTGGAGAEGLYTMGNLGADARGRPVGIGTDSLETTGGRGDDELWELNVAPGVTSIEVSMWKLVSRPGDTTDVPVVVFQARAASTGGDADGDRVPDAQEAECTRTDTDRDGTPDFLDADSDNDCSPDSAESGAARTTVARDPNINCRDSNECTADRCTAGVCSHPTRDAGETCPQGVCTGGAESMCVQCIADGNCSGGTPYCAVDAHECRACLNNGHCNDQNNCTGDSCREGSCAFDALPVGQSCQGGVCNGVSTAPMCVECVNDSQCRGDRPRCDTNTNHCGQCTSDTHCNDGNACTTDTCSAGSCVHTPENPGTQCSGGVCNGSASAPACVTCVSDAQCSGRTSHCDVTHNRCVACASDSDCEDGNSCTTNSCVAGACQTRATPAGQTCEGGYCNGQNRCQQCLNAGHCNDNIECTVDSCDGGRCNSRSSARGTQCAGGVCNGASPPMCVACVSDAQCSGATPRCNTATSQCVACLNDGQCNDNNACTTDRCNGGTCSNAPNAAGSSCPAGVCDLSGGAPACVACISDAQCRGNTAHCNAASHACQQCTTAAHCDDNNACTQDTCNNGTCGHTPTPSGATCAEGYCNGQSRCVQCLNAAQCNDNIECTVDACTGGRCASRASTRGTQCAGGVCNGASPPMCVACVSDAQCSGATPRCNTATSQCVACLNDGQCNDNNACTTDRCNGGTCSNAPNAAGSSCPAGVCDLSGGAPACVACISDAQCRGNTAHCNAASHACQQCTTAAHCDDNNACTQDTCNNGTCGHTPTPSGATCAEGYCNGQSRCVQCLNAAQCNDNIECTVDACTGGRCASRASTRGTQCAGGVCNGASPPMCVACVSDAQCSGATPRCNTATSQCVACLNDGQCNDNNACTTDRCSSGTCSNAPMASGASCRGGVCDVSGGAPACVACITDAQCRGNTAHCNAASHACQQCTTAAHCDDNNACTQDTCNNGTCGHTPTPSGATCANGFCDGRNACVQCVADNQCADTNSCTADTCSGGRCAHPAARRGTQCQGGVCNGSTAANACVACLDNSQCSGATACCDAGTSQCIACPPPPPPRAERTRRARTPRPAQ